MSFSGYSVALYYAVSGDTMCVEDLQGSSTQGGKKNKPKTESTKLLEILIESMNVVLQMQGNENVLCASCVAKACNSNT